MAHQTPSTDPPARGPEWFAKPDPASGLDGSGLRFQCTMCGNCCSGPEGYVLVTDDEIAALAARRGLSSDYFRQHYTHLTSEGRSLIERTTPNGQDCVFLDRNTIPGKAVCSVYEDRPKQCRTWPFWTSVIKSKAAWERAKRICPGIDKGPVHGLVQIRIARDTIEI